METHEEEIRNRVEEEVKDDKNKIYNTSNKIMFADPIFTKSYIAQNYNDSIKFAATTVKTLKTKKKHSQLTFRINNDKLKLFYHLLK